jgi:hypothetical protein
VAVILPAVIFTYGGDAPALPWCVLGARQAGLLPVVAEDAAAPLPAHTRGWMARRGVRLWATTFPRRGNLNGTECAAGICRTLAAAAGYYGTEFCLKLDTDTMVVRRSVFEGDEDAAMVALTCPDDRPGAYGMAYRLSAAAALEIAGRLGSGAVDPGAPEDVTVWRAAGAVGRVAERLFASDSGPFSGLPWDADAGGFAARFDVLTVGNPPGQGWVDRALQTAERLRCMAAAIALQGA